MSSEIDDMDLGTIDADPNDRISGRNHVELPKVGGMGAVKSIFNPANRVRLAAYALAGLLVAGLLIWSYASVKTPEFVGNGGATTNGNARTQKNTQPTKMQYEESQRYNEQELPNVQIEDPTAHPVVVTADNGEFGKVRDFNRPERISNVGDTAPERSANQQSGQGQSTGQGQQGRQTKQVSREQADFINKLMVAEGAATPQLQSVSWDYQQPAQQIPANSKTAKGEGAYEYGSNEDARTLAGELPEKCKNPVLRAGHQYVARSTMAANSDVGGPVILELVNGPLRKHRMIGKFERKEEWLRMEFNSLVGIKDPVRINAIGLDMETVLNAVGGDVDYHTFYRYGWWGFGTVLSAIGKAAERNADTKTIFVGDNVVQDSQSDTNREIKIALGDLGQSVGDVMKDRINRPLTVTVDVNQLVGVVFMDDICGDK